MFPADTFQPQYVEEREAAERTRRLAKLQEQHQEQEAAAVAAAVKKQSTTVAFSAASRSSSTRPTHLTLPQQHPAFVRPSAGVLGNVFQSFAQVRSTSQSPTVGSPAASGTSTPASHHSPLATPLKTVSQSEMEAMIAEKRREADARSLPNPSWYH